MWAQSSVLRSAHVTGLCYRTRAFGGQRRTGLPWREERRVLAEWMSEQREEEMAGQGGPESWQELEGEVRPFTGVPQGVRHTGPTVSFG